MTNEEAIKRLKEAKKILTIQRLATINDQLAFDIAISALSKQCASTEQVGKDIKFPTIHCCREYDSIQDESGRMGFGVYDPKEKNIYIAGDVPKEIFLKALFHEVFHWVQDVVGVKFDENDANTFSDILYDAVDMFDDHGPELFGQKTIVEPGEVFVGENVLKKALDQIAESDKMIKLKKRTITERLIIAESLINSVIADSDQFREVTKKTDDVPDTNVGKTDFKPGDKFILELGQERRMFDEFEIAGTDLYVETRLLEKLTRYEPEEKTEKIPYKKPEIIRCKDCQYRDPEDKKCDHGHGIVWQLPRPDDWLCADGKR